MPQTGRIDDIALFFLKDGVVNKRWISHDVYTDPTRKLPAVAPEWQKGVLVQEPIGQGQYYVTNLSALLPPGQPPVVSAGTPPAAPAGAQPAQAAVGDLVVIPWDDAASAYLVPKSVYEACPPIPDVSGADLKFMALTEGVVLANLPKADLAGMTCYLLNLLGLKSHNP